MHVTGGLYRELCVMPNWNALLGSGGRAAAAITSLSPSSVLYSYIEDAQQADLITLRDLGVELRLASRATDIAFSYFHPLSRPHIQPSPITIMPAPSIRVEGDTVLRFGFLEGDAVVAARKAVYDPQSWRNPPPFAENGSSAESLAIVLNELELSSMSGIENTQEGAACLLQSEAADVVVVKCGTRGAMVFERTGESAQVPAYRSSRVFKIGTGDVFSAVFAHLWGEMGLSPRNASDQASRAVADYCGSSNLPISESRLLASEPVSTQTPGPVLLEGATSTLGCRYAMEEARYVLQELRLEVVSPALDTGNDFSSSPAAALVLANGIDRQALDRIAQFSHSNLPMVVLRQGETNMPELESDNAHRIVTDDFVSAVYFAAWAAAGKTAVNS